MLFDGGEKSQIHEQLSTRPALFGMSAHHFLGGKCWICPLQHQPPHWEPVISTLTAELPLGCLPQRLPPRAGGKAQKRLAGCRGRRKGRLRMYLKEGEGARQTNRDNNIHKAWWRQSGMGGGWGGDVRTTWLLRGVDSERRWNEGIDKMSIGVFTGERKIRAADLSTETGCLLFRATGFWEAKRLKKA